MLTTLNYKPFTRLKLYDHLVAENDQEVQVEKAREKLRELLDTLEFMTNDVGHGFDVQEFFGTYFPGKIANVLVMCEQLAQRYNIKREIRVQFQDEINHQADRSGFNMEKYQVRIQHGKI